MGRETERAWLEASERQLTKHLERMVVVVDELARRYVVLVGMVPAGSGPAGDGSAHRPAGPRVPLRVDVLDLLRDVEGVAGRYAPLVRGSLRMGLEPGTGSRAQRVGRFLGLVADGLRGVYADDEGLAAELSRELWRLNDWAGVVVGERSMPFRLEVDCEGCGGRDLWVHPSRMRIRCALPGCGWERGVEWRPLVWTR
ncbi:hypothetical protein [Georgenia sp. MJ170]|uniref:hypothetical protein n=1 Tax=Georgenia sunbinii TaxID=3117728 RepID=UPI002F26284A